MDRQLPSEARPIVLGIFALALPLGIAAQQLALGLLAAVFAADCWRMRRVPRSPLDGPLALLLAAMLLSTAFCPDPIRSLRHYGRLWIVVAFFAVYHATRTRADVERLVRFTIASAVIVAVYGVVQHFTGIDLARTLVGKEPDIDPFWLGRGYRTTGLHPSGITYAHNLLFPLTFATAYGLGAHRRAWLAIGWLVMVIALVFSITRGAWLALAVVILLIALVRGGRTTFGALVGLAVLAVLLVGVDAGIRTRMLSAFDLTANLGRTQIWRANIDMARERPLLGWGYGSYKHVREPFYARYADADTTAHAHNDFLQMQVDAGAIGLVAFLLVLGRVLTLGWRAYATLPPTDEPARSLTLGAFAAVVAFLVGGLTQYNFGDAEVVIYLWFTVGVLLRLAALATEG